MRYFFLLLFLLNVYFINAQDSSFYEDDDSQKRFKVIGINTTPLMTMLIPFNRADPRIAGPYTVTFRNYRGSRCFRYAIGFDLSEVNDNSDLPHFNFRLGYGHRKVFHERWAFDRGFDVFLVGGDINVPNAKETESLTIGVGPTWGIEYALNPAVSINIETSLLIGVSTDDVLALQFIPPVGVFINMEMPRKDKRRRRR